MRSPATYVDARLTYDDFVHLPDDANRHEFIHGAHLVTPSPDVRHQAIAENDETLTPPLLPDWAVAPRDIFGD